MPTWIERYEILEKEGWTVCCESPFEIEHSHQNRKKKDAEVASTEATVPA